MKALTAFELLLILERARVSTDTVYRNWALDQVKDTLADCIRQLLTPPKDACNGCGAADCSALWKDGKKCCPDCTHKSK